MTRIAVHLTEHSWQRLRQNFASRGYLLHATTTIGRYTITPTLRDWPCCNIFLDESGVSLQPGERADCCDKCRAILSGESASQ